MVIRRVVLAALFAASVAALIAIPQPVVARSSETVYFNTESLKYHCPSCQWAKRCTKNCISITQAEAEKRGGVPCKVCGGTCP